MSESSNSSTDILDVPDISDDVALIDGALSRIEETSMTSQTSPKWLETLHKDLRIGTDVWRALDRTRTRGGSSTLRKVLLLDPLTNVQDLKARQDALRSLEARMLNDTNNEDWKYLAEREADVLWLVGARHDEAVRALYDETLIDPWPLSMLNRRSPAALVAWNVYRIAMIPIMGLLAPIFYVVVPYLVVLRQPNPPSFVEFCKVLLGGLLRLPNHDNMNMNVTNVQQRWAAMIVHWLSLVISVFAYFSGLLGSVQHAQNLVERHRVLKNRVTRAREFLKMTETLCSGLWRNELALFFQRPAERTTKWECGCRFSLRCSAKESEVKEGLVRRLLNHGECLRDYASFRAEDAEQVLRSVYELDAVVSILRARRDHGMSWAEFVDAPEPQLRMEGLAHPCLPPADVRRNDIAMGTGMGGSSKKHVLLTGPNAGGKSTLMKAMLCAALLAQTITVAPCNRSIALTPFDMLGSHLNVADSTGFESTFEAEMHRMAGVLSESDEKDSIGKKRLLAIDELFSSTNVVEGTAAAAACARRLGSAEQTLSVISTHFTLVAKEVPSESFECYSMPVKRTKQGKIEFPYKLTPGPSTQYIALELMAMHSGAFDAPLVADALRIKHSLTRRSKQIRCKAENEKN